MKTIRKTGRVLIALAALALTNSVCTPCGCDEATLNKAIIALVGGGTTGVDVHFEHNFTEPNTFRGTAHMAPPANDIPFDGTWEKSGDTITFKPNGVNAGGLSGTYTLTCRKNKAGSKSIVLKRTGLAIPIVYDCAE